MNFLNKLERKLGKYAIPNLSLYLILGYVLGYVLEFMSYAVGVDLLNYLTLNPYLILHGQIWRIVTWIIIPPSGFNIFFTVIMLFFYYSIGTSLERTWGTFYYNLYIFMGMIFTFLGSIIIMLVLMLQGNTGEGLEIICEYFIAPSFSTYYVNMSIFLAYAATFPDMQVLLMFIIPIKVKWMGIAYAVILLYEIFVGQFMVKIVIGASLLNFVVFFLMTRSTLIMRMSPKQVKRRHAYKKEVKKARPMSIAKHKCAVCGRNSEDNPEAEFRFCSKCNGNYEYCQEHLFTHTHVK
jgi:hypothetical protein